MIKLLKLPVTVLVASVFLALPVTAQHTTPGADEKTNPAKLVKDFETWSTSNNKDSSFLPTVSGSEPTDKDLDSIKLKAWKSYYGYYDHAYAHRGNVFSWQLVSSKIIFFMVILLVITGIYFAWLQFKFALDQQRLLNKMRIKNNAATAVTDAEAVKINPGNLTTEFIASGKEIKISSPVLGVIILVLSLLFFYLFLVYVYPVTELF